MSVNTNSSPDLQNLPQQSSPPQIGADAGGYRWVMLFGVWFLYFAFGLTMAAMAPLIGVMRVDLGLSDSAMGLILGAWPLVYIVSAMPCGAFLDRAGPRWALFVAAVIIALSAAARLAAGLQACLIRCRYKLYITLYVYIYIYT